MKGKFYTPRESLVPKGSVKVSDKRSDAVAYLYGDQYPERFAAMVFYGKSATPVSNYVYKTRERRAAAVAEAFEARRTVLEIKAERAAEKKAFVHDYKVGDIFRTCWGYDQTNVEFYQIVAVGGTMLTVREIMQSYKETGFLSGRTGPRPGKFVEPRYAGDTRGQPLRCKAQKGYVKIDGHHAWRVEQEADGTYATAYTSSYA